jgi:EAL domain-containing protein (putative c-di-GMP-specific phosphodiesterase class I)
VLDEACRQVVAWRRHFERDFFVSVNLSALQLRNPGLVEVVQAALETHGLPANALELEITESSAVESPVESRRMLDRLRAMGVRVAIDDFGTGYSSLGQIRKLAFDSMKLDRSLMADLYTDLGAQGVTTAVISMARSMRVRSVAEGIEDAETLEMVRALGCDEIQGHYISPPLGPREFESWLEDGGAADLARRGTLEVIDALEAVERRLSGRGR